MYLSRLILNQRSRAVRRDLVNVHDLHRTLMSVWGDGIKREDLHLLFRLESFNRRPVVLVQSSQEPDWSGLPEGYLDTTTDALRVTSLEGLITRLQPMARCRFRLFANPTKKIKVEGGVL